MSNRSGLSRKGTFGVRSAAWSRDLRVTADGTGVVSQVGAALLRVLADRAGLTVSLSGALTMRNWWPVHDRGRVLVDLAVMIACGGEAICEIDVLRHQGEVFGPVASPATCWRALDEIDEVRLRRGRCLPPAQGAGTSGPGWWCSTWTPPS